MAITKKQAFDSLHEMTKQQIISIEEYIDAKLSSPNFINEMSKDEEENPAFSFDFHMTITKATRDEIINRYTNAGWGQVVCVNCPDGIARITIYTNRI